MGEEYLPAAAAASGREQTARGTSAPRLVAQKAIAFADGELALAAALASCGLGERLEPVAVCDCGNRLEADPG